MTKKIPIEITIDDNGNIVDVEETPKNSSDDGCGCCGCIVGIIWIIGFFTVLGWLFNPT